MNNIKRSFGAKLKEIRKRNNYTQEALAEKLDLSTRQLIRIENGQNFPSVETLGKISSLFKIDLQSLFDFDNKTTSKNSYFDECLKRQELHSYIMLKLSNLSLNLDKLKYIKLAIDSLDNPQALYEFKNLLQNLNLIQ